MGWDWWWRVIWECNCRLLDALSGGFRGRGKESHARNIIGECNCRLLDALEWWCEGCAGLLVVAPCY